MYHRIKNENYDPNALIIVFFLRDGTTISSDRDFFRPIRQISRNNMRNDLYRKSYLFRTVKDTYDKKVISTETTQLFLSSYFGNKKETSEWTKAKQNLKQLVNLAQSDGISVGFVVFPILAGLKGTQYPFQNIQSEVVNYANTLGIKVYDLLPHYRDHFGPTLWVSAHDQHPNAKGHAIAAKALTPFVLKVLDI